VSRKIWQPWTTKQFGTLLKDISGPRNEMTIQLNIWRKSSWILSVDPVSVREAPLGVISGGPPLLSLHPWVTPLYTQTVINNNNIKVVWHGGLRVRPQNRTSWVRIPPVCRFIGSLQCLVFEKNKWRKHHRGKKSRTVLTAWRQSYDFWIYSYSYNASVVVG
jgi:hypothetical protein